MKTSLSQVAQERLKKLSDRAQRRELASMQRHDATRVKRGDRSLTSFCCNDYLNLSSAPAVLAAAKAAVDEYGAGAGASRLVTGNYPLLRELEKELAIVKGTDDAVVFGSGYLANLGTIPALVGTGDLILVDELSHACILGGSRLSGATELRFRHNDMAHLAAMLGQHHLGHKHILIVTDGVFSMDGDLAHLPDIMALATQFGAWVMTDDAHGLGTVGAGRGSSHAFAPAAIPDVQMGTLSKSLGSYGGYVCASHEVCELLRNRARSFVYSTGLPPASAGAARAALKVIQSDASLATKPLANAQRFTKAMDLPAAQSPIVPLVVGSERLSVSISSALEDDGFLVMPIRPPTVPQGTSRLRFTFTAAHTGDEIDALAAAVRKHRMSLAAE